MTVFSRISSVIEPFLPRVPDGFVVVSQRMDMSRPIPPYRFHYSYDHFPTLAEAEEMQRDLERGEYRDWDYVDIFPVRGGMPFVASIARPTGGRP